MYLITAVEKREWRKNKVYRAKGNKAVSVEKRV